MAAKNAKMSEEKEQEKELNLILIEEDIEMIILLAFVWGCSHIPVKTADHTVYLHCGDWSL